MYPREHRYKKRLYLGNPPQTGITDVRRKVITIVPPPPPPPPPPPVAIRRPVTPAPPPAPPPVTARPLPAPAPPPRPPPAVIEPPTSPDMIDVIAVDVDPSETSSSRSSRKSRSPGAHRRRRSRPRSRSESRDRDTEVVIERERFVPVPVPVAVPVPTRRGPELETFRYVEGLPRAPREKRWTSGRAGREASEERERQMITVRLGDRWRERRDEEYDDDYEYHARGACGRGHGRRSYDAGGYGRG